MKNIITIAQSVWLEMLRRKDLYIILTLQAFFMENVDSIMFGASLE
mgnify:CR=1 FL=1